MDNSYSYSLSLPLPHTLIYLTSSHPFLFSLSIILHCKCELFSRYLASRHVVVCVYEQAFSVGKVSQHVTIWHVSHNIAGLSTEKNIFISFAFVSFFPSVYFWGFFSLHSRYQARVLWSEQLGACVLSLRTPTLTRQPWKFQVCVGLIDICAYI